MQKQKKQMVCLLVLLVIFIAAFCGTKVYQQKQQEKEEKQTEADKKYVTQTDVSDITAFSYQIQDETLTFVKEGDQWISQDDSTVALDQSAVENLVSSMAEIEAEEVIDEPDNLSEYGFDTPVNVLTYTTADGTVTLTVGMENTITSQYYLTKSDDDRLYLVADDFPSPFTKTLDELKDTSEDTETTEAVQPEDTESTAE